MTPPEKFYDICVWSYGRWWQLVFGTVEQVRKVYPTQCLAYVKKWRQK